MILTDDTIGSLVDKLSIVNIKLFFTINDQIDTKGALDQISKKIRNDEYLQGQLSSALKEKEKLNEHLVSISNKITGLNSHRNDLIDMIDNFLDSAIRGEVKIIRPKYKKYGRPEDIIEDLRKKGLIDGPNVDDDIPF